MVGSLFSGTTFGQTVTDTVALDVRAVQQKEAITTSDLRVDNPGLLPTNPFYFLKEFNRNIQRVLTFNSVAKVQLEVKIANEKAAEVKKIQEITPNDNDAIIRGIENYQVAQERVGSSLESLGAIASTTAGFEVLMNSVATNIVLHQKVLDEIGAKASDSVDVKNVIDSAKTKIDESAVVAIQDDPIDFANKLQNALIESRGSDLKHIRSVEIIKNIEAIAPEAAKPALIRVQEDLTNKLNESIQRAINVSGSVAVQQMIKEIPSSDSAQRAITAKQLQQNILASSVKVTGISAASACDQLKQALEEISSNLRSGALTEEQYNSKYESAKNELELCVKAQQTPLIVDPAKEGGASTETLKSNDQVYCTQEAKLCSDGSYVSRTGLNCEFANCPGETDVSTTIKFFSVAYWQCYDGKEFRGADSCKTLEGWQAEAKTFCVGRCYANGDKCGVNIFDISSECSVIPSSSVSDVGELIVQDCGKENEKVNRDPLIGPVTKQCCYGLKEDRSNKSYSICYKPEDDVSDTTTSVSGGVNSMVSGLANPASVYCVSQGYKNVARYHADGGQYGVCIFNNGSECEEWKYYRGECKSSINN